MKILTVATDFPYPPDSGTKILSFERIRELSRRHDITLLCASRDPVSSDQVREMEQYCRCVLIESPPLPPRRGAVGRAWQLLQSFWFREPYFLRDRLNPEVLEWLEREVDSLNVDVMDADAEAIIYLRAAVRVRKVAILHSLYEASLQREIAVAGSRFERWKLYAHLVLTRWFDARLARTVDLCATVTPENCRQFQELHPHANVRHCLSNGVDLDYFDYAPPASPPTGVCFLGKMDYLPNVDAVLWFYRSVFPIIRAALPDFRFSIVGSHPVDAVRSLASDPAVEVTGYVDDVRPHVRRSGVLVLPMRMGSGILNKLLQGLALGVPVVATPMSLEGMSVVPDRDLLVADSPDQLAASIISLATDSNRRARLAIAGREYVERNHQWSAMARRYKAELAKLIRQGSHPLPYRAKPVSSTLP